MANPVSIGAKQKEAVRGAALVRGIAWCLDGG
jgi:hypothetical protein